MKLRWLAVTLLLGTGMGQEKPKRNVNLFVTTTERDGSMFLVEPECIDDITFRGSKRTIRNLFPEACGLPIPLEGGVGSANASPGDVPAVAETRKQCVIPNLIVASSYHCPDAAGSACPCGHYEDVPYKTCADKSRILEHDEQDPPGYWCRKVEPK